MSQRPCSLKRYTKLTNLNQTDQESKKWTQINKTRNGLKSIKPEMEEEK